MDNENIEKFLDEIYEFGQLQEELQKSYDVECDDYWNNLSYDDKLKAFYSVTKRIYKGDIEDNGSYRHVLYGVFGFDTDSYIIGIDSGYMDIHNSIVNIESKKK